MLLNSRSLSERVRLNIISKLFPVKTADILLLDNIEIGLKEAISTQVSILPLIFPQITDDFSLADTETEEFYITPAYSQITTCPNSSCGQMLRLNIYKQHIGRQLSFTCPKCRETFQYDSTDDKLTEDFTAWLKEQLFYPEIEFFSMLIESPKKAGKAYRESSEKEQFSLFDEEDKDCIHGLKKSWCAICNQKKKRRKTRQHHLMWICLTLSSLFYNRH